MARTIRQKLAEMSKRRNDANATTDNGRKQKLENQLQADMDEVSKMPATSEELRLIDEYADGKDFSAWFKRG